MKVELRRECIGKISLREKKLKHRRNRNKSRKKLKGLE